MSDLPVLVAAGVLVRREGRLLLQRRTDDGTWGVPGGALEGGESLEQTARRELHEETGLVAGALDLVDVYSGAEFVVRYPDGFAAYVVGATYETDDVRQDGHPDPEETAELGWFAVDELPVEVNAFNAALLRRVGLRAGPVSAR